MKQIQGRFNTALSFAATLDAKSEEQIRAVCDMPQFADSRIRIMPDVHAGKGCTIGTTMTLTDKVVPGMVGVDIGCGMETVRLAEKTIDCDALDALIRTRILYFMPLSSARTGASGDDTLHDEFSPLIMRALPSVASLSSTRDIVFDFGWSL